jgi:hypothetical protein
MAGKSRRPSPWRLPCANRRVNDQTNSPSDRAELGKRCNAMLGKPEKLSLGDFLPNVDIKTTDLGDKVQRRLPIP